MDDKIVFTCVYLLNKNLKWNLYFFDCILYIQSIYQFLYVWKCIKENLENIWDVNYGVSTAADKNWIETIKTVCNL